MSYDQYLYQDEGRINTLRCTSTFPFLLVCQTIVRRIKLFYWKDSFLLTICGASDLHLYHSSFMIWGESVKCRRHQFKKYRIINFQMGCLSMFRLSPYCDTVTHPSFSSLKPNIPLPNFLSVMDWWYWQPAFLSHWAECGDLIGISR